MNLGKEIARKIATDFYYWWHNQPGTNTQQGFDDFWEQYTLEVFNKSSAQPAGYVAELASAVPQTYGEAIVLYPWMSIEPHEWDNRTTAENGAWLIAMLIHRAT